jgi:FAD/FMN-containing dehydrogenase
MQTLPPEFQSAVAKQFPADFLSREAQELEVYGKDWTKAFTPKPSAIAFPRTTDEVARLMKLCSQHSIAVVPSGGRTGLSGGAIAWPKPCASKRAR